MQLKSMFMMNVESRTVCRYSTAQMVGVLHTIVSL